MKNWLFLVFAIALAGVSCDKDGEKAYRYFEVGIKGATADWRDSSFVVATANRGLIDKVLAQLEKPTDERQILMGKLASGNAGYNANAGHSFNWHFVEDDWQLVDVSAEIYDGRPYSDVHLDTNYWLGTLKRFSPWGSYIKREIVK